MAYSSDEIVIEEKMSGCYLYSKDGCVRISNYEDARAIIESLKDYLEFLDSKPEENYD